ncbi:MAG: hypothetical protein OEV92_00685 [Nitrospinota bacterium]|nr:hypothetical protein [Nitrospinota bacterium]
MKAEDKRIINFEMDLSKEYSEEKPFEAEVQLNMRHIGDIVKEIMRELESQKD